MIDRDLGQFLTDDERTLLEAQRKIEIARTLSAQANLLALYGSTDSHIHENVANMRATFNQLPTESIQKVQKSISEHTLALVGIQPVIMPRPEAITVESSRQDEEPGTTEAIESPAPTQNEVPVADSQPQTFVVESVSLPEEEVDERQPRELSPQLNNLFKRLIPFEQRSAIPEFSEEQNEALVELMGRIYEKGALRPEEGPKQMSRLRRLLNGDSPKDIAKDDGVDPTAIGNAFRVSLPGLYFRHKHEVARGFSEILAMQSTQTSPEQTVSVALEQIPPEEQNIPEAETAEVVFERNKPGQVSVALRNLFRMTLTEEQCVELTYFDESQTEEFFNVLKNVYSQRALKKSYLPLQLNRIELALNGASLDEIAHNEGSRKDTVRQSFYMSLAEFFAAHKEEVVGAFERIRRVSENESKIEVTNLDQEQSTNTTETVPGNIEIRHNHTEILKEEELVATMLKAYGATDPEARTGVSDLFSVRRGVIKASGQSIEAARYLAGLIQRSGISLSANINDSSTRSSVERLLYGLPDGESRKWATFSEILGETPEVFRGNKLRRVSGAFGNIARQLEQPSLAKEDPREKQIEALRGELHRYVEVSPELTEQIIDRALEKEVEYSPELGRALIQLHRAASGVGLTEAELQIIRLFTTPRVGEEPRRVSEIKEVLIAERGRGGTAMKHLENGYVSSMLLRAFDRIVTQRRDG